MDLVSNMQSILNELAPNHAAAARKLGVPRLTVLRWMRPSVGVRSTAHARLIIEALAKVRPVTAEDWQAVCAEPWAAPKETP